jgi:hypothetical protein
MTTLPFFANKLYWHVIWIRRRFYEDGCYLLVRVSTARAWRPMEFNMRSIPGWGAFHNKRLGEPPTETCERNKNPVQIVQLLADANLGYSSSCLRKPAELPSEIACDSHPVVILLCSRPQTGYPDLLILFFQANLGEISNRTWPFM